MPGAEQGHVTLLRPQNVPDRFKQCHLKACYVTEKQIGRRKDLRREGEGRRGDWGMKNTLEKGQGLGPSPSPIADLNGWGEPRGCCTEGPALLCSLPVGLEEGVVAGQVGCLLEIIFGLGNWFLSGLPGRTTAAHPGVGQGVCVPGLWAWYWCPLLARNVLPGVSHTIPRVPQYMDGVWGLALTGEVAGREGGRWALWKGRPPGLEPEL